LAFRLVLGVVLAAALAGCGSSAPSPESVARAWSNALNADDNETAAKLFAPNAEVVQAGSAFKLATHKQAVAWNAALPCSGRIVAVKSRGATVTVTFLLGDRKTTKCEGPGQRATAIFRVVHGKIVLWHQAPTPSVPSGPTV
jgi:limonene-1,2-epoxide hydrolase